MRSTRQHSVGWVLFRRSSTLQICRAQWRTGTVDAQENPLTNIVNFGLHLHHKHLSLTGHLLGIAPLLVNRARFDALPSALRSVLIAAARDSEATQRALAEAEDAECLELLVNAGVAVVGDDAIDLPAFRAAVAV